MARDQRFYVQSRDVLRGLNARPLRRVIEDELEHAIAEGVLGEKYEKGAILEVGVTKGEITLEQRTESAKHATAA